MASTKDLQQLVDRIKSGALPACEVCRLLRHESPLVRANALEALVAPAKHNNTLLDELVAAASDSANRVRLMGTIAVAHVAVGCIISVGTDQALKAAKALVSAWPETDRADLTWYLKSEGLRLDSQSGE
jgi:hypothetical protein